MEVRLGVVLRMRAILIQIAGRVYLADHGTQAEKDTYAALLACEDVNFVAEPERHDRRGDGAARRRFLRSTTTARSSRR